MDISEYSIVSIRGGEEEEGGGSVSYLRRGGYRWPRETGTICPCGML